jgi:hypothetical protein
MPKPKAKPVMGEGGFVIKRKSVPYEFVLDAMSELSPETRPMFDCTAIYVGDKIIGVLREKSDSSVEDNGMWLATTRDHHQSLRSDFPNMRSIRVLGEGITSWQVLPAGDPDFEEAALRACELILAGDPRIGKVPSSKGATRKMRARKPRTRKGKKS